MYENSWVWQYFYKSTDYHKGNHSARSAWCKACVDAHVLELQQSDAVAAATQGTVPRNEEQLQNDGEQQYHCIAQDVLGVLATKGPNCVQPKTGKPLQHMLPHLAKCVKVAPEIRERAQNSLNSQSRTLRARNLNAPGMEPLPLYLSHLSIPSISMPSTSTPSYLPLPPSQISTPELSPLGSPLLLTEPLPKRRRLSSLTTEGQVSYNWTPSLRNEFNDDLVKMMVSTGSSWNFANNPQVGLFMTKWVPRSSVPDRRTLSGPVLNRLVGNVEESMKEKLRGKMVMGTCDGWKNIAKQSIMAMMIMAGREVCIQLVEPSIQTNFKLN
jgi:hypothetical protein